MKTTLELPDDLFREVKSTAARRGVLMKQFITEALREKLFGLGGGSKPKPWTEFTGCMGRDPKLRAELREIETVVEDEFERIDEDDWA